MNNKEINYVSHCFIKNRPRSVVDEEKIFKNEKIDFNVQRRFRKETMFGKANRKSKKIHRETATENGFLEDELKVCEFFEVVALLKHINLDDESRSEILDSIELSNMCFSKKLLFGISELLSIVSKKEGIVFLEFVLEELKKEKNIVSKEDFKEFLERNKDIVNYYEAHGRVQMFYR